MKSSLDAPLRSTSVRIMIIMKEFLFYICFISLSTKLKLSTNIFIMSKFIKQATISWPLVVSYIKNKNLHLTNKKNDPNVFLNYLNKITKRNTITLPFHTKLKYSNC